ncbi:MAG: flagellar hook-length control protein FliK [Pseudomonadota bacterium]
MGNPLLPLPEVAAFSAGGKGTHHSPRDDNMSSAQPSFSDSMKAAETDVSHASDRSFSATETPNAEFKQGYQESRPSSQSVENGDTDADVTEVVAEFVDVTMPDSDLQNAVEARINALIASPGIAQNVSEILSEALSEELMALIALAQENHGAVNASLSSESLSALSNQLSSFLNDNLTATIVPPQFIQSILNSIKLSVDGQSLAISEIPTLLQPLINKNALNSTVSNKLATINPQLTPVASQTLSSLALAEGATADKLFNLQFAGLELVTTSDAVQESIDGLLKAESKANGSVLGGPLSQHGGVQGQIPGIKAQLSVATPFQQAQWGQDVAEQIMWMNKQGIQQAEIHMDPPELGPIQVKVSVVNEQAHVSFVVQNSSVREALDQSAVRLREMFGGEGLNLADVDVSDQSQQQSEEGSARQNLAQSAADPADETIEGLTQRQSLQGYSLVNTYV